MTMNHTSANHRSVPRTVRLLARLYLLRSIIRPRTLLLFALLGINGLLAHLSADSPNPQVFSAHMTDVFFGFLMPAMCLVLGIGVIRDEVDSGTMGYLLLRPISRPTIYLSRLLVACLVAAVFAFGGAMLSILALPLPDTASSWRILLVSVAGSMVFTVLFSTFGIVFKRPFLLGVGWLIGVERLLATVSFQGRYGAVSAHLQSLCALDYLPEGGLISKLVDPASTGSSLCYLVILTGLALFVGAWVFNRREYFGAVPSD